MATKKVLALLVASMFAGSQAFAQAPSGAGAGAREIREALDASRRSSFDIFARDVPLS